jgi:hypothetical protein
MERAEFVKGLRELADFLEAHEALPVSSSFFVNVYCSSKDGFLAAVRAIGNRGEKEISDEWARYQVWFGPIKYYVYTDREAVCTKVVKGTEYVPQAFIPAHTREIVEWQCEPWLEPAKG